jgi:hypothetical protein
MVRRLGPVTPTAELAGQRRRADHRGRPPVRRQGRPVDPLRLPHPRPGCRRRRRDLRGRGRPPARLQHQCHLPLDPHRPADRPPQLRQPALHPLGRPHPGRVPRADRRILPPGPRCPPAACPPCLHPPATARSASPKPPTGSAATPGSCTTRSTPASSPPAAAQATGCTSPGTSMT